MYIDTHVHFWKLERGDYGWLKPDNNVLYQNYLPDTLEPIIQSQQVEGIVVVEAAHTGAEVEYMLSLAEEYAFIKGVVGGLDITRESIVREVQQYCTHQAFKGMRINGNAFHRQEASTTIQPDVLHTLQRLAAEGISFDLLVRPDDLRHILPYVEKMPDIRAIVNHLGNPSIREQQFEPWKQLTEQMGSFPNIHFKLSGMITPAGGYRPDLLREYVHHLLAVFGPRRLMFGSDWPVCLQAGTYEEVLRLFEDVLPASLSDAHKSAIRQENAVRFYRL